MMKYNFEEYIKGINSEGAVPTYYSAKFSKKLHEKLRQLDRGGEWGFQNYHNPIAHRNHFRTGKFNNSWHLPIYRISCSLQIFN